MARRWRLPLLRGARCGRTMCVHIVSTDGASQSALPFQQVHHRGTQGRAVDRHKSTTVFYLRKIGGQSCKMPPTRQQTESARQRARRGRPPSCFDFVGTATPCQCPGDASRHRHSRMVPCVVQMPVAEARGTIPEASTPRGERRRQPGSVTRDRPSTNVTLFNQGLESTVSRRTMGSLWFGPRRAAPRSASPV